MPSKPTILELIELVYRAAAEPSGWPVVLQRLVEALDGTSGTIHHHQLPSQASNVSADWNLDSNAISEYTSYYGFRNIWRTHRPEVLRRGSINTSQSMCPDEVFRSSEYYNDFLRRYNLFHCLVGTLRDDKAVSSNLTVFRPQGAPNFNGEARKLLAILMPHLMRAFELHNRIQGLEGKTSALEDILNLRPTAIVLLDWRGRVVFANEAAAALCQVENSVRLTKSGIVAASPSENRLLARLISGALHPGIGGAKDPGGMMHVSRVSFGRPLQLFVAPVRSETLEPGNRIPAAVVFIADPDRNPRLPAEQLQQMYGLTRAESRLAQLLLAGFDLKQSSDQLGVRMSTVRAQLKSIFVKTETNRQSDLLRLLLLGPAQLFSARPHCG